MGDGTSRDHHLTVVVSSGDLGAISDDGPPKQVSLQASDPLVLGSRRHHPRRGLTERHATEAKWPGTAEARLRRRLQQPVRPARLPGRRRRPRQRGVPTWPPTQTPPAPWHWNTATMNSEPRPGRAPRPALGGRDRPRRPSSCRTWLPQPDHLRHRPHPPTTKPSTTSSPATTPSSGPPVSSSATTAARLGPSHRLGQPQRTASRSAAGAAAQVAETDALSNWEVVCVRFLDPSFDRGGSR